MERYNFTAVKKWRETKSANSLINLNAKKKFYCLEMFPYPSGKIHMDMLEIILLVMLLLDINF